MGLRDGLTGTIGTTRTDSPARASPPRAPVVNATRSGGRHKTGTGRPSAGCPGVFVVNLRHLGLAALVVAVSASLPLLRDARAQDTMARNAIGGGSDCGCRGTQAPPWHGSVRGPACGPSCPPPTLFHADPCGQLCMRQRAHQMGAILPPCFPRLHGWLVEGHMPSPPPPAVPRCHQCGAAIEGGF